MSVHQFDNAERVLDIGAGDHFQHCLGQRGGRDDDLGDTDTLPFPRKFLVGIERHPNASVPHVADIVNATDIRIHHSKRFDQFHKSASLNGAAFRRPVSLARRGRGVHSYSSADGQQVLNPLPHSTPEPSRERAQSHGSMRRQRRQTCGAGRASSLIAGNWSYSRKKGKVQLWGQPAPSPTLPNVRQSLGFPIRCNVTRSRAAPNLLYLMRPASNLGGLRPVQFSGSKFRLAVERCNALAGLNHVQQRSDRFADVSHTHSQKLQASFADQLSDGATQDAGEITQGLGNV